MVNIPQLSFHHLKFNILTEHAYQTNDTLLVLSTLSVYSLQALQALETVDNNV